MSDINERNRSDPTENVFIQELENTRKQAKNCALTILEYIQDENLREGYLKQLTTVLEGCCHAEHSVALARKAAQEASSRITEESSTNTNADLFDEMFDENLEELKEDSDLSTAVKRDQSIKDFKKLVFEHRERENHNGLDEDDDMKDFDKDLVTTQQTMSVIDPISKVTMTDPVRHKPCGHVYDRGSVTSMIKTCGKKGFRCPTMGCGYRNPLKVTDLEDAPDVKREIQRQGGGTSSAMC